MRALIVLFATSLAFCQLPIPGPIAGGGGGGSGSGGSSGQYSSSSATYTVAAPWYFPAGGGLAASTTRANVATTQGSTGSISAFATTVAPAPSAGTTLVFTWYDGTTSEAVTCTVAAAATTCSDTTHTFTYAAGDALSIQMSVTGGSSYVGTVAMVWGTGQVGPTGPAGPAPSGTGLVVVNSGTASTVTVSGGVSGVQGNGTKAQLSTGTTTTNDCVKFDANGNTVDAGAGCGTSAFSSLTGGTNTGAAMVVGSGASLAATGSGTIGATAVPLGGVTGLGTGVGTALAAGVSGTGNIALVGSPSFTTPALGTPSAVNLANATNLPTSAVAVPQGNGSKVQLSTGTTTTNDCVKFDANGNTVDAGSACGGGSTAFPITVSGTVNSGGIPYFNSTTQESSSATLTAHGVLLGEGSGQSPVATSAGTSGQCFTSNGSSSDPSFQACPSSGTSPVFSGSAAPAPAFSATPTFSLAAVSSQSPTRIEPGVMTANVTAVTFTNVTAGAKFSIAWTQAASGGPYTVTYGGTTTPACNISPVASIITVQEFEVGNDGSTVRGTGCSSNETGVSRGPFTSAPTTVSSSTFASNADQTNGVLDYQVNISGTTTTSYTGVPKSCTSTQALTAFLNTGQFTCTTITAVGTITTGVWNGTTIAIANGGTGQTSALAGFNALSPMTTAGDLIYGGTSGSALRLGVGSNGNCLVVTTGAPAWGSCSGAFSFPLTVSGTVNSGGIPYFNSTTQMSSSALLAAHGVVIGGGAGSAPLTTAAGTSGQCLTSNGASADPTFQTCGVGAGVASYSGDGSIITNNLSTGTVTTTIAGTSGGIPYFSSASGWTSSALLTHYGFIYGGGAGSAPVATAQCSANTLPHGNGASAPTCSAVASGDISNNAVGNAQLAVVQTRRVCVIENDTQSATALVAAQFSGGCIIPSASTIVEVDVSGGTQTLTGTAAVRTFTGTSSVQIGKYSPNGGANNTGLLSAALATASGVACALTSTSGTCINGVTSSGSVSISTTSLSAGDMLQVTSASPDTAQTWYNVSIIYTVN